jgi:hypothetical protein
VPCLVILTTIGPMPVGNWQTLKWRGCASVSISNGFTFKTGCSNHLNDTNTNQGCTRPIELDRPGTGGKGWH